MSAKQYGRAWVYSPIPCFTGALHAQPCDAAVRMEACTEFTHDYNAFFDMRQALDAPDSLPSGGVKAQDFTPAQNGRLLIAHVWRP